MRRERKVLKELRPGAVLTRCLPARILRIAMGRRYLTVSQAEQTRAKKSEAMLELQAIVAPACWDLVVVVVHCSRLEGAGEWKH